MDVLIRDVPEEDMAVVDRRAAALGLSRNSYLKRMMHQVLDESRQSITPADWGRFTKECSDLGDENTMREAWS